MLKVLKPLQSPLLEWVIFLVLKQASGVAQAEPSNFPRPDFPIPDGTVFSLLATNDVIYVGGGFQMVRNRARPYLAALGVQDGKLLTWDPDVKGPVTAMAISGNTVYAGIRGTNAIGAFDIKTGQRPSAWAGFIPTFAIEGFLSRVNAVTVEQGRVYLSGEVMERLIYALDPVSGAVLSWNPNELDQSVGDHGDSIQVLGNVVYVAGKFLVLGGQSRTNLAALDRDTAAALPWDPAPNGRVRSMVISSNLLFVGGEFTKIGGQSCNGLAAIDLVTGDVTAWDPCGTNQNTIRLLAVESNKVYVVGTFHQIGGQSRTNLAALDVDTGDATGWNPSMANLPQPPVADVTNQINALAVSGDTVYVGGGLHFPINGSSYPYLGVFPPRGWSVLSQARFTNGNFSFRLLGEEGSNYVIQASATLTNWLSVYTNSVANGAFGYSEPATNKSVRYYRAVSRQ